MATKSSQGIRETIQLLSSGILTGCGMPRIPSETFRQAKFNRPEATTAFWCLLFHTIQLLHFLDTSNCKAGIDKLSFETFSEQEFHPAAFRVRRSLCSLGYTRLEFYCSCECVGSRELLLAFGWLVHKTKLFAKLRTYHLTFVNEVTVPLKPNRKFLLDQIEEDVELFGNEVQLLLQELHGCTGAGSLEQKLRKMVWLRGKLQGSWRAMLGAHQAYQKVADLLHKHTMHSYAQGSRHLTVHEIFLLRYPDQLSSHLQSQERHLLALQNLIEWEHQQPLFWQWMESVVDLCEKEKQQAVERKSECEEEDAESIGGTIAELPCLEVLETEVQMLEREVVGLLVRNKPHIDRLNHIWGLKKRNVPPKELKSELESLNLSEKVFSFEKTADLPSKVQMFNVVQTLSSNDSATYLLESVSARKVLTSLAAQQQDATQALMEASRDRLTQIQATLVQNEEVIRRLRGDIMKRLEEMDKSLPPSICRVDTGLPKLS